MAIDVAGYNRQFIEKVKSLEAIFNNAEKYGVLVKGLLDLEFKQYWHVIGVHHLTGAENMGNHNVFCDVLDEDGRRINGARLKLTQALLTPVYAVVDKPANEPGTNFPIWGATPSSVSVFSADGTFSPSEEVTGLKTNHADEELGNTIGHHSFYVVFQRTTVKDDPSLSLEETIALVGQPLIIPLNLEAMFYKVAKERGLGERLTSEYDVRYTDKTYRAQVYEKGIIYAEVDDWANVKVIARTN